MDQFTRRIVGFAVHNDPLFKFYRWQANLRVLEIKEIKEIKSVPYTPTSHSFVERLIGTCRREFLDKTLFWNQRDLLKKLELFQHYYNEHRSHHSLDGEPPLQKSNEESSSVISLDNYKWKKQCGGLFQLPIAA